MVISLTGLRRHWALVLAIVVLLAYMPWTVREFATPTPWSEWPGIVNHFSVSGRWVALAFADGPDGLMTAQLAQDVSNYGDQATFFVVGLNVRQQRRGLLRARQLGDDIESHSEGHINLAVHSYGQDLRDLTRANRAIARVTGVFPHWLLPPYGAVNARVMRAAHTLGLSVVLPSPGEDLATNAASPTDIVQHVLAHLTPGAIIVLDANTGDQDILRALPTLLGLIRLDGYHVGTVVQLWDRQHTLIRGRDAQRDSKGVVSANYRRGRLSYSGVPKGCEVGQYLHKRRAQPAACARNTVGGVGLYVYTVKTSRISAMRLDKLFVHVDKFTR